MKKSTVRVFAIVLAALMVVSLLPLAYARAEEYDPNAVAAAQAAALVEGTPGTELVEPSCGREGFVSDQYGNILQIIPATGAHVYEAIVHDDYLIEEGESYCLNGNTYWKSCINRNADGSVCGYPAEEAYEQAKNRVFEEMNQRRNNGEQHTDAEWADMLQRTLDAVFANYTFKQGGEGHAWVSYEGQEATCTSDGWKPYRMCATCGELADYVVIPATGHRWGEEVVVTEPTCEASGLRRHVCEICGVEETEAIPALGHKYGEFTVLKEPTCTEDGEQEHICAVCDKHEIVAIPALGHRFGAFTVTKEPTCTVDGEKEHICAVCEFKETEAIPAAHKFGEYVVIEEPGCYSSGVQERTCTVCGEKEQESIPAAHKYGEFVVTMEPTCYSTGERRSTCTVCGDEIVEWIDPAHKYENGVCVFCGAEQPDYVEPAAEPETEPAAEPETEPETVPETVPETEPETVPETEPAAEPYTGAVTVAQTVASEDVVDSFTNAAWDYLGLNSENTVGVSVQNITPYKADGTELSDEEIPAEGVTFEMAIPEGFDPANQDIEIYHRNKDGEWEKMEIVEVNVEQNKIIVRKVRSFSPFTTVIVNKRLDDQIAFVARPAKTEEDAILDDFSLLAGDSETFDSAEENVELLLSDNAVFDAGSDYFETPILQIDGEAVNEAVSGQTLSVYVEPTAIAPAGQTYQYRWIRDTGSSRGFITGATSSTYTLTDTDCGSSIYCSVNVAGNLNEAELTTGVHVRKVITMIMRIRPDGGLSGGEVTLEFGDNFHSEIEFNPVRYQIGDTFTISTLTDTNGNVMPLMTEDSLKLTVTPKAIESDNNTQKGYYIRYVALNETMIIPATSQEATYTFSSLNTANDADVITVFFDLAECQPNEKNSQGPTTESDQQLHNNTKIWEEFEAKYAQKPGQGTPFPVIYYYVTPKWLGAPTAPMSSSEVTAVGGFNFKLGLPSGADFEEFDVRVYHYVATRADWEEVPYTKVESENAVQITNFTNFSPFAVVARPTVKVKFESSEPEKGTVSNESITPDDKGDFELPKAEFSATNGWTFAGWLVDDKLMQPGDTVKGVFENKTVYPKWTRGYAIIFDDNDYDNQSTYGALVTGKMEKQLVYTDFAGHYYDSEGKELAAAPTLNKHAFQLKNHSFQGWSDKAGSGDNKVVYDDEQSVADIVNAENKDVTLYAVWKRESVSVMFNANGGSGAMDEQKGPGGSNITLNANKFEAPDENKIFAGWSKTPDGNVDYKNGETITVPDTDLTLYAVWREKVAITFKPKSTSEIYGGTGDGTMSGRYYPSGATVTLPRCEFTAPSGKAFAFWSDRQDGTGNIYPDRYEGYWTGNTELYAQWGDKLTIHYDPNGGDGANKTQVVAQGIDVTLATLESTGFSRDGYKFLGWDTIASKKSNPKYEGGQKVEGGFDQDNVTLYAIWDQVEITGNVLVSGTLSGLDGLAFVGETLECDIFNEKKFTDFTYVWTDDDGNVLSTESTYVPKKEDFGKTIVCTVTAHSPYEAKKVSNEKTVGIEEEDKRIVNRGETEIDYVYGLYPGMYYSTDGGKTKYPVTQKLDKYGRFELTTPGIYYFYRDNTDNTVLAVVNVENWWTIGYATSGSGTVRLTLDNTTLTSATRFTTEQSQYIEYYNKLSGYTCWIVKEGASIGTFTLTVTPASGNYAHVYLNEKLLASYGSAATTRTTTNSSGSTSTTTSSSTTSSTSYTRTFTNGTPLDSWKMYRIVFNNSTTSPRTADESNLGLWSALCMTSLTGAAVILTETPKRRKNAK